MTVFHYLTLFISIAGGGSLFFLFNKPAQRTIKLLLAFSGAYLFALSVLHLMPDVYKHDDISPGKWILTGFFLQILMEYFSEGIEHGHVHVHREASHGFPFVMMISLCLHSFLEAMPLATNITTGHVALTGNSLMIGIILHHIPVAFALMGMLVQSGIKRKTAILLLIIFSLMTPLGGYTGELINLATFSGMEAWQHRITGIVIGIFLHISTTILFESGNDHRFNLYKLAAIVTGGFFAWMIV